MTKQKNTKQNYMIYLIRELGLNIDSEEFELAFNQWGMDDEYSIDYQNFKDYIKGE